MVKVIYLYVLFVVGEVQLRTESRFTNIKKHSTQEALLITEQTRQPNVKLFTENLTPQEPLWEAPVKKSTTALTPEGAALEQQPCIVSGKQGNKRADVKCLSVGHLPFSGRAEQASGKNVISSGLPLQKIRGKYTKEKRSAENEFRNIQDEPYSESYDSTNEANGEEFWGSLAGRKKDETAVLKNLLHQGAPASFGTTQEAKEEDNTIKEIEQLSRESSFMPNNLHLPYMNGPSDNLGLDFSKMDISVGKFKTDFDNNGENSEMSFLKRHFIPVKGHEWETRNRDRIPRHRIFEPEEEYPDERAAFSEQGYDYYPKLRRFPAFAPSLKLQPSSLHEQFDSFPPIAPAILSGEEKQFSEPISPRELEPEPEPSPISEYIPLKEPAPIPELPSLREIPPISEPTQPTPENLNPKDTFGS